MKAMKMDATLQTRYRPIMLIPFIAGGFVGTLILTSVLANIAGWPGSGTGIIAMIGWLLYIIVFLFLAWLRGVRIDIGAIRPFVRSFYLGLLSIIFMLLAMIIAYMI